MLAYYIIVSILIYIMIGSFNWVVTQLFLLGPQIRYSKSRRAKKEFPTATARKATCQTEKK